MGELTALARERAQRYPDCKPHYHDCERDHLRCLLERLASRIESLEDERDADKCRMADMEPAARIYTDAELVHRDPRWGRVCWIVPECEIDGGALLYLRPAPQPQPERQPVSEPTEAQIEAAADALIDESNRGDWEHDEACRVAAAILRAALAAKDEK